MQACDAYISNPFLDAIGTGLVERLVMRHVIMNLIVSKSLEGDIGGDIKTTFLSGCEQTDTRSDLMGAPGIASASSTGLPSISLSIMTTVSAVIISSLSAI